MRPLVATVALLFLLVSVAVAACERDPSPGDRGSPVGGAEVPGPATPDRPEAEASPADMGAEGAVAVVRAYYRAIGDQDYREAYAFWEDGGRASGQSYQAFAAGFAETASVAVEIGVPGRIEGAAGSRYIDIPVTITATQTSGRHQRFAGSYVLRRAVVDGASVEQRHWHIYSADIARLE